MHRSVIRDDGGGAPTRDDRGTVSSGQSGRTIDRTCAELYPATKGRHLRVLEEKTPRHDLNGLQPLKTGGPECRTFSPQSSYPRPKGGTIMYCTACGKTIAEDGCYCSY